MQEIDNKAKRQNIAKKTFEAKNKQLKFCTTDIITFYRLDWRRKLYISDKIGRKIKHFDIFMLSKRILLYLF